MTRLRKLVLAESAIVEEAIDRAIQAFHDRDMIMAERVISGDRVIDEKEIEVEEECLRILALCRPVATDLRFVVAVLKLNNDLERMGDLAVSIARRARFFSRHTPIDVPDELQEMGNAVRSMVQKSLDALINGDDELAREVCRDDDHVDDLKRHIKGLIKVRMERGEEDDGLLLKLLDVPRHLERIADLATNVAEDVIYMVTGEIIRHQKFEEYYEHREGA